MGVIGGLFIFYQESFLRCFIRTEPETETGISYRLKASWYKACSSEATCIIWDKTHISGIPNQLCIYE